MKFSLTTKLSPHFTLNEFVRSQTAARHGIDNTPSDAVYQNLLTTAAFMEEVRRICAAPITISSGYRSPELNLRIGGSPRSQHITGQAVDFTAQNQTPRQTMNKLVASNLDYNQLILEHENSSGGGWVHISWSKVPKRETLEIDKNGVRVYDAS
jgi:zinc D-Ala-D-Ala carboxypeptidase